MPCHASCVVLHACMHACIMPQLRLAASRSAKSPLSLELNLPTFVLQVLLPCVGALSLRLLYYAYALRRRAYACGIVRHTHP